MTLVFITFALIFSVTFGAYILQQRLAKASLRKQYRMALNHVSSTSGPAPDIALFEDKEKEHSFSTKLRSLPLNHKLELLLEQADIAWTPEKLLLICFSAGCLLAIAAPQLVHLNPLISGTIGAMGGLFAPLFYVRFYRTRRLRAFEGQFPNALDYLSRALRSSHAFSASIEMLSTDAAEPTRSAFSAISRTTALGSPLNVALANLIESVPLIDVRFFVSAVLLQQETGGNLGEILNSLANVIRERAKIRRQIRAASAHGRMTAFALSILPVGVGIALMLIQPGYLSHFAADPRGKLLLLAGCCSQGVGWLVINWIVDIKV